MGEINKKIYLYRETDHDLVDCLHHLFECAAGLFDRGEECVRISVSVPQASEYEESTLRSENVDGSRYYVDGYCVRDRKRVGVRRMALAYNAQGQPSRLHAERIVDALNAAEEAEDE